MGYKMARVYTEAQKARIKERGAAYRLANKEKINARDREYYREMMKSPEWAEKEKERKRLVMARRRALDPVGSKAATDKWRADNPEKVKASYINYRKNNPDKVRESAARRYKENPEKMKACVADWQRRNSEKLKSDHAAWIKRNTERTRVHKHNRRDRAGASKLSIGIVKKLLELQRGRCACCRSDVIKAKYHLDHIMPLALGGVNEDSNMQILCAPCNLSKHAKHPIEFMQQRGLLL